MNYVVWTVGECLHREFSTTWEKLAYVPDRGHDLTAVWCRNRLQRANKRMPWIHWRFVVWCCVGGHFAYMIPGWGTVSHFLPFVRQHDVIIGLQHEHAQPHAAAQFLEAENVQTFPHWASVGHSEPSRTSSCFCPWEYLWTLLRLNDKWDRKVKTCEKDVRNNSLYLVTVNPHVCL